MLQLLHAEQNAITARWQDFMIKVETYLYDAPPHNVQAPVQWIISQ